MDNAQALTKLQEKKRAVDTAIDLLNERRKNINKWKPSDLTANKVEIERLGGIAGLDLAAMTGKEPKPIVEKEPDAVSTQ